MNKQNQGDNEEAIEDYTQAITLDPDDADPYYNRGLVYKKRRKKQEALADFRKAANLYLEQGNTELYQKALKHIRKLK